MLKMATAIVNKVCHVCYSNFGRSFTFRNVKNSEFLLFVAGIRKRNITKVSPLLNHVVNIHRNSRIQNGLCPKILKRLSTNPPTHRAEKGICNFILSLDGNGLEYCYLTLPYIISKDSFHNRICFQKLIYCIFVCFNCPFPLLGFKKVMLSMTKWRPGGQYYSRSPAQ